MTPVPAFLLAALGVAATPGSGTLYVLARTLQGGRAAGLASVAGAAAGGLVHVAAAAFGGAALAAVQPSRLRALSIAGALYMAYLAQRTWRAAAARTEMPSPHGSAFRQALVIALLNPQTALFLLAFLPQFVDPQGAVPAQMLVLGGITVAFNATAHLLWMTAAAARGSALPRDATRLARAGGVLLLASAILMLTRTP